MQERELRQLLDENLGKLFAVSIVEASKEQIYQALATTLNDILRKKRKQYNQRIRQERGKRVYYMSMEFLLGRSLKNNLFNLGLTDKAARVLSSVNLTIDDLYECESDAGLGNGGLGRLAAAYLDGLSSNSYPAMGFSICYEYGLFKQKIVDGWQTELPDVWLPGGSVWLAERPDKMINVKFGGHVEVEEDEDGKKTYKYTDYDVVEALPFDMMIGGYGTEAVNVLRLWKSQSPHFNIELFAHGDYEKAMSDKVKAEILSKVLYPADNHIEGKTLRLKQQYFLVSASIHTIINEHLRTHDDIRTLPESSVIHINDTHPTMCIPELLSVLIDEHNLTWDEAWDIVTKMVNYTNHTILSEALERWPEDLIARELPRIHVALDEINVHFWNDCYKRGMNDEQIRPLAVIHNNEVRMANLCVIASVKVNGVSALHSEILKKSLFKDYVALYPNKFCNVTNGITYRRWLCQANPLLSELIESKIGPGFKKDPKRLEDLKKYLNDTNFLNQLNEVKYMNKCFLAKYVYDKTGIKIDPNTRFDCQVKRLHEYKRQLLNALKIVYYYTLLENNPDMDFTPQTFIFGAKAAGSYYVAKQIIELICSISADIQKHPKIREKLNVVFLENYNVTMAEKLMPASEVSEQISLAGKEASGTGNMKFMINGAVTFGTMDGANVEIFESVGNDNIFIFGMDTLGVQDLWNRGYFTKDFVEKSPRLQAVIAKLNEGFNGKNFKHITDYLLNNYPVSDPYMCIADFENYMAVAEEMDKAYKDRIGWAKKSLMNIASSAIFAADRSIEEYAKNIWNLKKIY